MKALFQNPNFRLYALGQSASQLGSQMTKISLPLYVLHLTGSAALFSTVLALGFLPTVLLYPLAGVWVDRLDRRRLLIALDFSRGIFLGLLVAMQFTLPPGLWVIIAYMLFNALCDAFELPVSNTIIPHLFEKEHYDLANSLNAWVQNTASLLAPSLGIGFYSLSGLKGILAIDAATFFLGAGCSYCMKLLPHVIALQQPPAIQQILEGFQLFKRRELLLPTLAVCVSRTFIDPIYSLAIPFVLISVLKLKNFALGVTSTATVAGLLCAPVLVGWLRSRFDTLPSLHWSRSGKFAVFLTYAIGGWLLVRAPGGTWGPLMLFGFVCFAGTFFNTAGFAFLNAHFQGSLPKNIQGRFAATRYMTYALATPFGLKLYGLLLHKELFVLAFALAGVAAILETALLRGLFARSTPDVFPDLEQANF